MKFVLFSAFDNSRDTTVNWSKLGHMKTTLVQFIFASRKVYNEVFPFNSFPTARKISFPHPDKLLHEFWQ